MCVVYAMCCIFLATKPTGSDRKEGRIAILQGFCLIERQTKHTSGSLASNRYFTLVHFFFTVPLYRLNIENMDSGDTFTVCVRGFRGMHKEIPQHFFLNGLFFVSN